MSADLLHYYGPGFVLLYALVFSWRVLVLKARLGKNPVMLRLGKWNTQSLMAHLAMVVFLLIGVQTLLYATRSPLYEYVKPIEALERPWAGWAGVVLTLVGAGINILAHVYLGPSWRLGIDEAPDNVLALSGPYRFVRHPIYTALGLITAGLFLLMPSGLSAGILAVTVMALNVEAGLEERYLIRVHGDRYRQYIVATGRWWPRFRRASGPERMPQDQVSRSGQEHI